MNFSDFQIEYEKTSVEHEMIISRHLECLYNCKNPQKNHKGIPKDLLAFTLRAIMTVECISYSYIYQQIEKKDRENGTHYLPCKETIISEIKRYSVGSLFFDVILEIIGVSDDDVCDESYCYRHTYLHNLWEEQYKGEYPDYIMWLFSTLTEQNQKAVYYLTVSLNRSLIRVNNFKHTPNLTPDCNLGDLM